MTLKIVAIQHTVAERYGVTVADMVSERRTQDVVWPRFVAMYFAKTLTKNSLVVIGRHFGQRDHTTVLHGVRRVASACLAMPSIAREIEALTEQLLSAASGGWPFKMPREVAAFDHTLQMCGYEIAIVPIGTRDEYGFPKNKNGNEEAGADR